MSRSPNRNSASIDFPNFPLQDPHQNVAPIFKPLRITNPSMKSRSQSKPTLNRPPTGDASSKLSGVGGLLLQSKDQSQEATEVPRVRKIEDDKIVNKEKSEVKARVITQSDKALVMNIMNKNPDSRSDGEVVFLQQILRKLKFFSKAEEEMRTRILRALLRNLKMETFEAGQHVFDYGDIGKKFYIIIQGSAYVLIKGGGICKDKEDEDSPTKPKKISEGEFKLFMTRDMPEDLRWKKLEGFYPGFVVARTLYAGESFGEIALQSEGNRRRTATIVCREETLLGVVHVDDYQTYLEKIHETKNSEIVNLLSNLHLFKHWSRNQLLELIPHCEESVFFRNQHIFKEGEEPNKMYFVLNGEIEIWKKVDLEERSNSTSKLLSPKSAASPLRSKLLRRKKDMRLAIICSGEYIGASGLRERKARDHSAIASSPEARLLSLTREKFTMFISDIRSLDSLIVYVQQKEIWREKIANNFMNINSLYDPPQASDAQSRASPASLLPNISPTNKTRDRSNDSNDTQKKIDRMISPSRGSMRPVISFFEKSPIKKLTTGFTPITISTSPMNSTPTPILNKRPGTRESERLQVLLDQKSTIKKKIEVDVAFSKLQKKLNKLLEEEEFERMGSQPDEQYSPKHMLPDDFAFNFTKKGAPIIENPANPQSENNVYTDPGTIVKSKEDMNLALVLKKPKGPRESRRSHSIVKTSSKQKGAKFKLIKRVGFEKLVEAAETSSTFLQTYMGFVKDAIESRDNWSTSPPLRIVSRMSPSPSAQQLIKRKELHQRDVQASSVGFSLTKQKREESQEKDKEKEKEKEKSPGNRVATANVTKRLYGKVQQAMEYEKINLNELENKQNK